MPDWIQRHPERAITVALTLLVAIVVVRLIRRGLRSLVKHGHISPTMGLRMGGVVRWAVLMAVTLAVLQQTGVFRQAWAVLSAAAAALAVGFVAGWSVLSNVTASVLILIFKPFRIGDRISLREQDKVWVEGEVVDMSLMFVTITNFEGEYEHFPANMVFQRVVRVLGSSALPSSPGTFFERRSTMLGDIPEDEPK